MHAAADQPAAVASDEAARDAPTPAVVPEAEPIAPEAERAAAAAQDREERANEAAVEAFARDHDELKDEHEKGALDFLLAPKPPRLYGVTVDYDTEAGILPLTFVISGQDGRKLDRIEQSAVSETTGKIDAISAEIQVVAAATDHLVDHMGNKIKLVDPQFLTVRRPSQDPEKAGQLETFTFPDPVQALEARFKTQLGLLGGVATRVRQISGYDPRKIGDPQRRLAAAVGNS